MFGHVLVTDPLLAEIASVLRPGGALVVTTPNLASLENRVRLLLGRYPMWMDVGVERTGHLRYYTPRMLRHQLGRHGLRVERHVGNWVPLVPQRFLDDRTAPWLGVTGDWFPSLAMGILMTARRDGATADVMAPQPLQAQGATLPSDSPGQRSDAPRRSRGAPRARHRMSHRGTLRRAISRSAVPTMPVGSESTSTTRMTPRKSCQYTVEPTA